MVKKGQCVTLFGKKEFSERETRTLIQSYSNLLKNVVFEQEPMEALFLDIENDLHVVCLVGLEEEVQTEARETIGLLTKDKLKLNLFSEDEPSKALPCGFNTTVIAQD